MTIDMTPTGKSWYCLRAQLKREHIAASLLKSELGIEVFLPRLRHRKKTVRGPVTFTEALFPGYLFACFDLQESLSQVRSMPGVAGVVHFNQDYQTVPDKVIEELQQMCGNEILEVSETYQTGDAVEVVTGSLSGIRGLVRSYIPARERVIVLMEFLGREAEVEMEVSSVIPDKQHPLFR